MQRDHIHKAMIAALGENEMDLAKRIRLNRIFSGHESGNLCSVAVDHFIGYQKGFPVGLVNVPDAIAKIMKGKPDAMTMLKGMAKGVWDKYAGAVPLIIQSIYFTPDDAIIEYVASAQEVVRMGADAIAVAIGCRGPNEGRYLKVLTKAVEEADAVGLPVMAHIYPRDFSDSPRIVHDHENIMWAVRCGVECGADVIKVPFTGDVDSYREIVSTSPVPVVAAGGPRAETLKDSLDMLGQVMKTGARGATIGRNIWGVSDPTKALLACKAVIHEGLDSAEAMKRAGL
jgi:class I fructose-bisphosphate aldolase